MILWGIIELGMSTVGAYNIIKGLYNMYCDAEEIKEQYRKNQQETQQYLCAQKLMANSLTESQYTKFEGEFAILNQSCILDPHSKI